MLKEDYTAKLLNLEDVKITNVENISGEVHIYIELPRKKHICPACGAVTDRIHDYRTQVIKDVPLARNTFLHLHKRRYQCSCGKRFFEKNSFLPRYYRVTSRLVTSVIRAFEKLVPAKEIGRHFNVSGVTAMRYFRCVQHTVKELPKILSLDEFKGNSGGEKYNCIVADPQNRKVIDILPNRYENNLIRYFSKFESRENVRYFVCDMNSHFRRVAKTCFKNAVIVADRFHVIRQVDFALERIRKNEQAKLSKSLRIYFKRSRFLLMKPMNRLNPEEMSRLNLMFRYAPRLAEAYRLKFEFHALMHSGSSAAGRRMLTNWLMTAEAMHIPEFENCITAYRNWFDEILNSLDVPWSNGFVEGCNNKTKVLKRVSFGMRNFRNFRNRILYSHSC